MIFLPPACKHAIIAFSGNGDTSCERNGGKYLNEDFENIPSRKKKTKSRVRGRHTRIGTRTLLNMDHVYYHKKSVKHYKVYKKINKMILCIDICLKKFSNTLAVITVLFKTKW